VTVVFEQPTYPRRVGSDFDGDTQRLFKPKATAEGFVIGAQPALLKYFAALGVNETQVTVLVAEIQASCCSGYSFVTIAQDRSCSHS
jgi:hypothetical protein